MHQRRITVAQLGTPDWPRFGIQRGRRRFWTGKTWSPCADDAILFSDEQQAINQAIVLEDHIRPRRFVATCLIVMDDDEPFTVKDLQKVLEQGAVSLAMSDEHEHTDIYITLDWRGIEEIK